MNAIQELTSIVQAVGLIESSEDQVRFLVDSISSVLQADVCSLYRALPNGDMKLLASHGLDSSHPVVIPNGKGIVGRIAQTRHPLNISDASTHPDYFYVAETHEERFHGYCGVPLVLAGNVIGVFVIQTKKAEKLQGDAEAFLVTLASNLAFIVSGIKSDNLTKISNKNIRLKGIAGAPGIGFGRVHFCHSVDLFSQPDSKTSAPEFEKQQWQNLLAAVSQDLAEEKQILSASISDSVSSIFEAYQTMLNDPTLTEKVHGEIDQGYQLVTAIKHGVQFFYELFLKMEDPYLRARGEDIVQLGNKLFQTQVKLNQEAQQGADAGNEEGTPVILVGQSVAISDIAAVPIESLAGVVCFEGAKLSHIAVLSKALGIPSIMGLGDKRHIHEHEFAIIDGNEGELIIRPSSLLLKEYQALSREQLQVTEELRTLIPLPSETTDGTKIRLFANTGLLADIEPGLQSGAEGIGLYRTEMPFLERESFPSEEEQVAIYGEVFSRYPDKPIYVRTLDIGGDKPLPYFPVDDEENPALGWRGVRFSLDNASLCMTQIRAILIAGKDHPELNIMLPMVSSASEIIAFRQLLEDGLAQVKEEYDMVGSPRVGIMIEVPAAISQITAWRHLIDFISIGTNDLSQYLLAMDRNNKRIAKSFDTMHPAVLVEIERIALLAKKVDLPVCVCGEMASDPLAVTYMIGMGIRQFSMSASNLLKIKSLVRSTSVKACESAWRKQRKVGVN